MKKTLFLISAIVFTCQTNFAGGIVTNTNQSAAYVRMLARDATLGIDAVYYNPAGTTKLGTGLHLSLSNQFILQNRTIETDYPYLNSATYEGKVTAPLFPSLYVAFNTGKLSFSVGINPIGGGGSAEFLKGLPSFEYNISDLTPSLSPLGVTGYSTDLYFKGKSVYWGAQIGAAYEVNEMLSVYLGGRYVIANTTYQGHIKDNQVNLSGVTQDADDLVNLIAGQMNTAATGSQAIVDAGGGSLTYAEAAALGIITPTQQAQFENGLIMLGYPATTPIQTATGIYSSAALNFSAKATLLGDQEVDVTQTGTGITPILGANLTLANKMVNIGIKYEFKTNMTVTNETSQGKGGLIGYTPQGDPVYQFPDGEEIPSDMPAVLSVGAALNLSKLTLSAGYHQYFDKSVSYGKKDETGEYIDNESLMEKNNNEIAVGAEYNLLPILSLSAGYLHAATFVNEEYQSDLNPAHSSNTGAFGVALKFTNLLTLNAGMLYTHYLDQQKQLIHYVAGNPAMPVTITENYKKDNTIFAIGIDINLSK
jgi:long-subunit fatty acid transport protein